VTRSLSGENTRLALYETKVASSVQLLRMILRGGYFTSPGNATGAIGAGSRLAWMDVANVVLREKAEFLLGWNVDLLARVNGQRRIGKGLRESVSSIFCAFFAVPNGSSEQWLEATSEPGSMEYANAGEIGTHHPRSTRKPDIDFDVGV
jgi:hypothetical protein